MKVVYGHTDSIYVQIDSLEKAQETVNYLNEEVRKIFPNVLGLEEHPVTLEFEKYFKSLGVGATKNRNAGLITWKDGEYLDEDEFFMTGFTAKRISETKLAKDVQITTLKMWVEGKTKKEILDYLQEKYNNVLNGDIDINEIIKRSSYKEERFHVHCTNCKQTYHLFDKKPLSSGEHQHSFTGVTKTGKYWKSNGKRVSFGSQIMGAYYYRPNFIAGIVEKDFEGFTPDWEHYANVVVKKAEPIFTAMGWESNDISKDLTQRTLDEWW
jgi:DNA polymerase elongation subunit (family B)